jgi:hypothetical protein
MLGPKKYVVRAEFTPWNLRLSLFLSIKISLKKKKKKRTAAVNNFRCSNCNDHQIIFHALFSEFNCFPNSTD